jgi:hypothetical protein
MKKQNKIWLVVAGTLIVGTGAAQTWTLDTAQQSSQLTTDANQSAVAVDPVSGRVDLVTGGTPPPNPTLTIQAPTVATVNQAFQVSYTASNFTPSVCTATSTPSIAGWNGTLSGTSSQATASSAGTVSLSLSCTRANGSPVVANNVSVAVNVATNCPAPNILGAASIRGSAVFVTSRSFVNTYGTPEIPNPTFPPPTGAVSAPFSINFNEVNAIDFVMPSNGTDKDGQLQLSENPATGARGIPIIAISSCAGDASNSLGAGTGRNCLDGGFAGQTAGMSWTDNDNNFPQSSQKCRLLPGMPYFINLASNCAGSVCGLIAKALDDNNRPAEGSND